MKEERERGLVGEMETTSHMNEKEAMENQGLIKRAREVEGVLVGGTEAWTPMH